MKDIKLNKETWNTLFDCLLKLLSMLKLPINFAHICQYDLSINKVIYAVRHEWARTADDIIARRTRLAFLNKDAAIAVIPRY